MRSLVMKPDEEIFRVVATDEYGSALYSFPLVCFVRPKILFKDGEKPIPRFCARSCHLCSSQWIEGRMRTLWFTSDDKFLDAVFTDEIGRVIYAFHLMCLAPWAAEHKHCTAGCRHFSSFKDCSVRKVGGNWICICNALTGEHRVLGTAARGRVLGGKGKDNACLVPVLTEEA